jgi:glycosyltransferase involved in cell wall biosynthesis
MGVRPLRILHVTPYSAGAWAYGGIPRLSDTLARGFARRGHDVTVCATDACDSLTRLPPQAADDVSAVTVRIFPNVSNRLAFRWQLFLPTGLSAYLRRSAGTFDLAHVHACRNLPGVIAAHHLRRAGVPYVLAPNGTAPRIERRLLAKRIFDIAAGHRVVRHASRLIAVSNAEREQLARIGVSIDRIRTVPNPIDVDGFDPRPAPGGFRQRIGVAADKPIVLFLGQLLPRKRVDVLVRAFARLRDVASASGAPPAQLVIAGNDAGAGPDIRRVAREAGVLEDIIFTGLLRGSERLAALAAAAVVVYPSQHEVFGLVPLEALLCHTAVVVANDSGCAEIVRSTGGGQIVPVGDADSLTHAIATVLRSPDAWRAAATQAAVRVRERFAADVVCSQLEQVYRELVAA